MTTPISKASAANCAKSKKPIQRQPHILAHTHASYTYTLIIKFILPGDDCNGPGQGGHTSAARALRGGLLYLHQWQQTTVSDTVSGPVQEFLNDELHPQG